MKLKYIAIALLMVLCTAYPAYARMSVGVVGGGVAAAGCTNVSKDVINTDEDQYFLKLYNANKWTTANDYSGGMTQMKLKLYRAGGATGTVTVKIYSNLTDETTSLVTNAVSGNLDISTITESSDGAWYTFTFATPPAISNATTYWIVVLTSTADYVHWKREVDARFGSNSVYTGTTFAGMTAALDNTSGLVEAFSCN